MTGLHAVDIGSGHVGVAHAGGEGAHGPQQVHMAVRAQDHVAGLDEARLQHDVLADAVVDVKEMPDALPLGELTDDLLVVGDLLRMGGGLQVEGVGHLVRVPHPGVLAHFLLKLQHAVGAAEVSGGSQVHLAPDPLPHLDRSARGPFHDFHDGCFAHGFRSFFRFFLYVYCSESFCK